MKPLTNKTVYNPYALEEIFHSCPTVTVEDQKVMGDYLELKKIRMKIRRHL